MSLKDIQLNQHLPPSAVELFEDLNHGRPETGFGEFDYENVNLSLTKGDIQNFQQQVAVDFHNRYIEQSKSRMPLLKQLYQMILRKNKNI